MVDPLELNSASRLGVPGLIDAIRAGGVAVENMPGSGFIESRAMLAFLPRLAERLIGERAGDAEHRDLVVRPARRARRACSASFDDDLDRRRLRRRRARACDATARAVGAELGRGRARGADARHRRRAALDYVGQEVVRLSTMPRWEDGKLAPRPFVLRVYAAATPDGWR